MAFCFSCPQQKWGAKVYEKSAKLFFINDFVHRQSMRVSGRSGSRPQAKRRYGANEEATSGSHRSGSHTR